MAVMGRRNPLGKRSVSPVQVHALVVKILYIDDAFGRYLAFFGVMIPITTY
jgi:hypothetical protein